MREIGLLCTFLIGLILNAQQQYAVIFSNPTDKIGLENWSKENSVDFLYMSNENAGIVMHDAPIELETFGFVSQVNQIEKQIVYNTDLVLLKVNNNYSGMIQDIVGDKPVKAHAFIPNLYYVQSQSKNEEELKTYISSIQNHSGVHTVECKQVFTIQSSSNDPLFPRQWSITNDGTALQSNGTPDADMDVDSAWTISEGDASIKIAILDSGVDTLHEDLVDNIITGFDGFMTDSTDTKGYPTPNFSSDGHGTACAGIAAAKSNNNIGVAGVAPNCQIVPIRIFYYQDYGGSIGVQASTNTDALLSGSAYAWRVADCDIMSTSAGLSPLFIGVLNINTQLVTEEINEAFVQGRNGYGIPMFFSAGNDDFNDVLWPGDLPTTIAVGASSMCDERKNPNDCSPESWGSSYGLSLDVVAPGVRITTTDMSGTNGYAINNYTYTFNGTSAACPNAAGVGALILSYSPGLHARDVKAVMSLTADRVGGYVYDSTGVHGTWNEEMGHGRVNAFSALKLSETYPTTVGIPESAINQVIKFYPNPSNGTLSVENASQLNVPLTIFNSIGATVYSLEIPIGIHDYKLELPSGIYFVQNRNGTISQKLIIK